MVEAKICKKESLRPPKSFLLVFNIGKQKNAGSLIRSAGAFGTSEIFLVENKKKHKPLSFGSQGVEKQTTFRIFPSLGEISTYCKREEIRIIGIEINHDSVSIQSHPFSGDTLFMLGNEGTGLNQRQKEICDSFVYIPQYTSMTASLNVAVAGSIVLHHFGVWAGWKENDIIGEKYEVDQKKCEGRVIYECSEGEEKLKEKKLEEVEEDDLGFSIFDGSGEDDN